MAFEFISDAWNALTGQNKQSIPTPRYDKEQAAYERAQAERMRGAQGDYQAILKARMMGGGGPSVAQSQMMQGRDAAIRAGTAAAASARGGNAALASQAAARNAGLVGMQTNAQLGTLRAQEQLAAQQQYGQALAQQQQADLAQRGMSNQLLLGQLGADTERMKAITGVNEGNAARQQSGIMGAAAFMGAALGLGGMSGLDAKEQIRPVGAPGQPLAVPQEQAAQQPQTGLGNAFRDAGPQMMGPDEVYQQQRMLAATSDPDPYGGQPHPTRPLYESQGAPQTGFTPVVDAGIDTATQLPASTGAAAATPNATDVGAAASAPSPEGGGTDFGGRLANLKAAMKFDPIYGYRPSYLGTSDPRVKDISSNSQFPLVEEAAKLQPIEFKYKDPSLTAQANITGQPPPEAPQQIGVAADGGEGSLANNGLYRHTVAKDPMTGVTRFDGAQVAASTAAVTSELAKRSMAQDQKIDTLIDLLTQAKGQGPTQGAAGEGQAMLPPPSPRVPKPTGPALGRGPFDGVLQGMTPSYLPPEHLALQKAIQADRQINAPRGGSTQPAANFGEGLSQAELRNMQAQYPNMPTPETTPDVEPRRARWPERPVQWDAVDPYGQWQTYTGGEYVDPNSDYREHPDNVRMMQFRNPTPNQYFPGTFATPEVQRYMQAEDDLQLKQLKELPDNAPFAADGYHYVAPRSKRTGDYVGSPGAWPERNQDYGQNATVGDMLDTLSNQYKKTKPYSLQRKKVVEDIGSAITGGTYNGGAERIYDRMKSRLGGDLDFDELRDLLYGGDA